MHLAPALARCQRTLLPRDETPSFEDGDLRLTDFGGSRIVASTSATGCGPVGEVVVVLGQPIHNAPRFIVFQGAGPSSRELIAFQQLLASFLHRWMHLGPRPQGAGTLKGYSIC